ncbi:MAG: ABC-three component system protein, partial [Chlorobium sp.]
GITSPVSDQLRISSYQVDDVNRFLNARDIGLAQQIAAEVKELYTRSQTVIPDSVDAPNERYVWLVESLIPEFMRKHPHSQAAYRQAAQVIIAKYFETCDAYEHPNSINPA